jgi:hypothetical protein
MGTGSFPGVESGRGVMLTPHPLLVPRSKKLSRAIPLLSLRAFVAYEKGETKLFSDFYLHNIVLRYKCQNIHSSTEINKGSFIGLRVYVLRLLQYAVSKLNCLVLQ